ncbi:hypothetical protein MED297_13167 [Reinekea sp. MED297]|uniref:AzlD domain-containing protein n=2 Tax=Reinekea TaxID=230494 RepID=A4BCA9_9GAMM|nr:hypothetical protein MED297_13167 [Reinekea sp. MED297] [Reinekea blandensis MED297]
MINLLMILGMITVTWGVRALPFVLPDIRFSPAVLNVLNCVPAAVLAALVAEPVLSSAVEQGTALTPEVLAAALCVFMGLMRLPMLVVVVVGMAGYWGLRVFIGS